MSINLHHPTGNVHQDNISNRKAIMTVRQEVNNFERYVVVQELEFAMNLALYGLFMKLG